MRLLTKGDRNKALLLSQRIRPTTSIIKKRLFMHECYFCRNVIGYGEDQYNGGCTGIAHVTCTQQVLEETTG